MMTSSNGNIFYITGHLCGEFISPGNFPTQRPVTWNFDVSFDLRINGWVIVTHILGYKQLCHLFGSPMLLPLLRAKTCFFLFKVIQYFSHASIFLVCNMKSYNAPESCPTMHHFATFLLQVHCEICELDQLGKTLIPVLLLFTMGWYLPYFVFDN